MRLILEADERLIEMNFQEDGLFSPLEVSHLFSSTFHAKPAPVPERQVRFLVLFYLLSRRLPGICHLLHESTPRFSVVGLAIDQIGGLLRFQVAFGLLSITNVFRTYNASIISPSYVRL